MRSDKVHGSGSAQSEDERPSARRICRRIIDEIALGVAIRILRQNLDAVLVGIGRSVRPKSVENRPDHFVRLDHERWVDVQTSKGHVVRDANSEAISRLQLGQFVEHRLGHGGREVFRRQPVAAADHARHDLAPARGDRLGQGGDDVEI